MKASSQFAHAKERLVAFPLLLCLPLLAPAQTYYVAVDGSDISGTGSSSNEWATVNHAIDTVPDGALVLVREGLYDQRMELDREFPNGITIRSEVPYRAAFRADGAVVRSYYGRNITVEGFDIAHDADGTNALVVQIQDLLGDFNGDNGGSDPAVSGIVLRDNVIHDSRNNDVIKINNGAKDIIVEGNLIYNQAGSDEHIDINSVTGVIVQDNIFVNNFAASGRPNNNDTSSFIVVKDSNADSDTVLGSRDITIRRNIFLNWEGSNGQGFLRFGEDGTLNYEADGALVENNLFIGNSSNLMRSPLTIMGCANITFRNNTVVGDLPSRSFAMRVLVFGDNQVNTGLRFYNNIWCDPAGTMGSEALNAADFSESDPSAVGIFTLDNNLYWNNGAAIPADAGNAIVRGTDASAITTNPQMPSVATVTVPSWNGTAFADGSASIRQVFLRLVEDHGTPGVNSTAADAARPDQAPSDDLLGNPRSSDPDIGAVEFSVHAVTDGWMIQGD